MLPRLNVYLHAKNLKYHLNASRNIDEQRILQSNLTRDTSDHIQPKLVVSYATFP